MKSKPEYVYLLTSSMGSVLGVYKKKKDALAKCRQIRLKSQKYETCWLTNFRPKVTERVLIHE